MDIPVRDAALLLLGHGSTLNADSSAPTWQHAEEIRRRGVFAEVHVGFWKEEPNFRQALRQTDNRQIYVVPNFISSGYFTEEIIPRELGLDGPVTCRGGQVIFYCRPVGLHPAMTEALLRRARDVVTGSSERIANPAQTACLFICGHGTSLNDNSTKIIHDQAALIRARGLYADCQPVLMKQSPFIKDWRALTPCPDVIVVPFFISDGLHSFEHIPVLLGLTPDVRERSFINPHHENGRRLWYATAIGTELFVADVILAQVEQFQTNHLGVVVPQMARESACATRDELARFFQVSLPPWKIGEVAILPGENGAFTLLHRNDLADDKAGLRRLSATEDWRELVRLDREGLYRPLRAAPNLRRGWIYHAPDLSGLQLALDYLYPAALANWRLWRHQELNSTAWRETAGRQSGRFRIVRELDEAAVDGLVVRHCQPGCLKQRLWSPAGQTLQAGASEIPLLCPEACNYLVSQARAKLKGPEEDDV